MIIDVIYDDNEIYHVLEPNVNGIRGISVNHKIIRDDIQNVRLHLAHLDQTKIDEYENEKINSQNT